MKNSRVPKIGELVNADGHNGDFKVISVDKQGGVADLELMTGTHFIERHIPFIAIHPIREDVNQAAARVMRESTERD